MKNLSLALDELRLAESRALLAGKWTPVTVDQARWWKSPGQEPQVFNQDDAVNRLKKTWGA